MAWRRVSVAAVLAGMVAAAVVLMPASARAANQKVVCITSYDPPRGAYRERPQRCELHKAGAYPIASANLVHLRRMHWKKWGGQAKGVGKIGISTVGLVPAKVKLLKPRSRCGATSYTKARVKFRDKVNGHTVAGNFKLPLTSCLH